MSMQHDTINRLIQTLLKDGTSRLLIVVNASNDSNRSFTVAPHAHRRRNSCGHRHQQPGRKMAEVSPSAEWARRVLLLYRQRLARKQ